MRTKNIEFGMRLKELRKKIYKTQQEFADAMDVSIDNVKNWEQGRAIPEPSKLFKIQELLDCSIDYLFGRIDFKNYDIKFIHQLTGLSENAITKLCKMDREYIYILSELLTHDYFDSLLDKVNSLSDKKTINSDLADMIVSKIKRGLQGNKTTNINGNYLESALLFRINELFTGIIKDITDTV